LNRLLDEIQIDGTREDEVKWAIDKYNVFTTKSLYYVLTHGGVRDHLTNLIWKSKVPLKV